MDVFRLEEFRPQWMVVAGGEPAGAEELRRWSRRAGGRVVCCDGAAVAAIDAGIAPTAIVGDGDSLPPEMVKRYRDIFVRVSEQETNDLTKAVDYIERSGGAEQLVVLGATGRREDHTLGNISLAIDYYRERGIRAVMPTPYGVFIPCRGGVAIAAGRGREVSVFNLAGAAGFRARGLQYPLPHEFTALWQGTLNVATEDVVEIEARGYYIVYIANPD